MKLRPAAAIAACAVVAAFLTVPSRAGEYEDAKKLELEAQKMLARAMGSDETDIEASRKALELLEKARGILEPHAFDAQAKREQALIQEINSLIYWTRKTSPIQAAPPAPAAELSPEDAQALHDELLEFEEKNKDEPMKLAARFFEAAERLRGSDWGRWALSRARQHQEAAARAAEAERKVTSEIGELARPGDELMTQGKSEEAAAAYSSALEKKPDVRLARKVGQACFQRGSDIRAEYAKAYLEAQSEYMRACFAEDRESMRKAVLKVKAAEPLAKSALGSYAKSREAYEKAAQLGPGGRDIESEVYIALTFAIDLKPESRRKATELLGKVIAEGKPSDVRERMLLEHAKNELDALKKRPEGED